MILQSLSLENFRCHRQTKTLEFADSTTIITGENARGKTTLLEAVYMLSRGRGFREDEEIELLSFGQEHGYVEGEYKVDNTTTKSSITYQRVGDSLTKRYILGKTPVGLIRYRRAQTPVVLFAPHQIDIIVHGPSYRREYLDSVILAVDPTYTKVIREYESALRKRNALLEDYTSIDALRKEIIFWNEYLVKRATVITEARTKFIDYLNAHAQFAGRTFHVTYLANEMTIARLEERFHVEAAAHRTLIGPQKDDIEIMIRGDRGDISAHTYASRSQQRLTLLYLKMHELDYVSEHLNDKPILLLDDVYSEFDGANRHLISSLIPHYQTIVTTTEEIDLPTDIVRTAHKIGL